MIQLLDYKYRGPTIEFTLAGPQYSQASHKQPPKIQRFSDC